MLEFDFENKYDTIPDNITINGKNNDCKMERINNIDKTLTGELIVLHITDKTISIKSEKVAGLVLRRDNLARNELDILVETQTDRTSKRIFKSFEIDRIKY